MLAKKDNPKNRRGNSFGRAIFFRNCFRFLKVFFCFSGSVAFVAFTWFFVAFHFASSAFTDPLFSHPLHCQFRCGRWLFGFLAFLLFCFFAFLLFCFLAFWLFGFLAFWLFLGFLAFWLFGFLALAFRILMPSQFVFGLGLLHPQHRKFLSGAPRHPPFFFDHHGGGLPFYRD